jgi:type VI protein secretion system component VasK
LLVGRSCLQLCFGQFLGQARPQPQASPELLWSAAAMIGLLLLGAAALWWVKRWRARLEQQRESPQDQLQRYRDLLTRGEISAEEYERIAQVLHAQARPVSSEPPAQDKPPESPAPPSPGS